MIKRTSISEDITNAEQLERYVRNNKPVQQGSWLNRRLDLPTLILAVIGGAVSIAAVAVMIYPLAKIIHRFYFP